LRVDSLFVYNVIRNGTSSFKLHIGRKGKRYEFGFCRKKCAWQININVQNPTPLGSAFRKSVGTLEKEEEK
jgi:hypothetical protein